MNKDELIERFKDDECPSAWEDMCPQCGEPPLFWGAVDNQPVCPCDPLSPDQNPLGDSGALAGKESK